MITHALLSYRWFARVNPVLPPRRRSVSHARRWLKAAKAVADAATSHQDLRLWAARTVLDQGSYIEPPGELSHIDGTLRRQARDGGGITGRLLLDLAQAIVAGTLYHCDELSLRAWTTLYPRTAALDESAAETEFEWLTGEQTRTIAALPIQSLVGMTDPTGDWRVVGCQWIGERSLTLEPVHPCGGGALSLQRFLAYLDDGVHATDDEVAGELRVLYHDTPLSLRHIRLVEREGVCENEVLHTLGKHIGTPVGILLRFIHSAEWRAWLARAAERHGVVCPALASESGGAA